MTSFTDLIKESSGFSLKDLSQLVSANVTNVKAKLDAIKSAGTSVSIGNMFDMQLLMNRLSQFSEMATSVVSASNSAITSMARNVK